MQLNRLVGACLALAACGPATPAAQSPATTPGESLDGASKPAVDAEEGLERFEALLTIDEKPGAKKLQGVWLTRDDGERWIASYRPLPWFESFDGLRVKVAGKRYEREGQGIAAPHIEIYSLEIAGDPKAEPMAGVLSLGPETKLRGELEERTVPDGAKREGEQYLVFVSEAGASYLVTHSVNPELLGQTIDVLTREYEPSPYFAAMMGGRYLWIIEVVQP